MRYPQADQIVWQFDTANFRVVCAFEPEDMDPADTFCEQADIDAVRNEDVLWFHAVVSVWYGDDADDLTYLAHDSLGGCAYATVEDFTKAHIRYKQADYFTDMVKAATSQARERVLSMGEALGMRKAA